jgi:hypothetical protein
MASGVLSRDHERSEKHRPCGELVPASARPCPPVPRLNFHGKEGVDGSSPSEGLALNHGLRHIWCPRLASIARLGQIWVRSSLEPVPRRLVKREHDRRFRPPVEVSVARGAVRSKGRSPANHAAIEHTARITGAH